MFKPQLEFPVGCFRMGPNGMDVIESASDVIKEQTPGNSAQSPAVGSGEDDDDEDEDTTVAPVAPGTIAGYNTIDILSAVSDSAEEGLALLSSWFGLTPSSGNSTTTTAAQTEAPVEDEVATEAVPHTDS